MLKNKKGGKIKRSFKNTYCFIYMSVPMHMDPKPIIVSEDC